MTIAPWVTPTQIASDPRLLDLVMPAGVALSDACAFASDVLFHLSGSRYNTKVEQVRPHHLTQHLGMGLLAGSWGGTSPVGGRFFPEGWGCGYWSGEYVLPGLGTVDPASVTVVVEGVTLTPQGQAGEQWHLYSGRRLVRVADPVTNAIIPFPCCQILPRPLGQQGTWSVTYTTGTPVPPAGVVACYELAVEVARFWAGRTNALPQRVAHVARQGVTVDLANTIAVMDDGKTGFWPADMWLETVNPYRLRRRSTVTSVDRPAASRY